MPQLLWPFAHCAQVGDLWGLCAAWFSRSESLSSSTGLIFPTNSRLRNRCLFDLLVVLAGNGAVLLF